MPKWISAAFALFLSLQVFSTKGETVDDVINKYVEALGGRDRLISIKTVYAEAVVTRENGKKITVTSHKVQDKLFRRKIVRGLDSNLLMVTDSGGWKSNPNGGTSFQPLDKNLIITTQPELDCAGPLLDYISKGYIAELTGRHTVNGISCYGVMLTLKSGLVINYFIDAENWHIIREIRKDEGNSDPSVEMIIEYSNYRKTRDGYIFPYKVTAGSISNTVLNYQKIEVNKPVNYRLYKPGY